jgi:hypothetical protein
VARVDVTGKNPADAIERLHRRLIVDLERVAERSEFDPNGASLALSSLLARPERMTQGLRFLARSGVQSYGAPEGEALAHVTVRVEDAASTIVAEHTIDADFVAPLCGALLGSGARTSPEACIVAVVVAMLHEELAR